MNRYPHETKISRNSYFDKANTLRSIMISLTKKQKHVMFIEIVKKILNKESSLIKTCFCNTVKSLSREDQLAITFINNDC